MKKGCLSEAEGYPTAIKRVIDGKSTLYIVCYICASEVHNANAMSDIWSRLCEKLANLR